MTQQAQMEQAAVEARGHAGAHADAGVGQDEVEEELLVEDVSIDGMCGVY